MTVIVATLNLLPTRFFPRLKGYIMFWTRFSSPLAMSYDLLFNRSELDPPVPPKFPVTHHKLGIQSPCLLFDSFFWKNIPHPFLPPVTVIIFPHRRGLGGLLRWFTSHRFYEVFPFCPTNSFSWFSPLFSPYVRYFFPNRASFDSSFFPPLPVSFPVLISSFQVCYLVWFVWFFFVWFWLVCLFMTWEFQLKKPNFPFRRPLLIHSPPLPISIGEALVVQRNGATFILNYFFCPGSPHGSLRVRIASFSFFSPPCLQIMHCPLLEGVTLANFSFANPPRPFWGFYVKRGDPVRASV